MLSCYDIRVSLVLIGGSATVSVSLCRVCYDAFCTMTSDGRRWIIQRRIHTDQLISTACCYCSFSVTLSKCLIVKQNMIESERSVPVFIIKVEAEEVQRVKGEL